MNEEMFSTLLNEAIDNAGCSLLWLQECMKSKYGWTFKDFVVVADAFTSTEGLLVFGSSLADSVVIPQDPFQPRSFPAAQYQRRPQRNCVGDWMTEDARAIKQTAHIFHERVKNVYRLLHRNSLYNRNLEFSF